MFLGDSDIFLPFMGCLQYEDTLAGHYVLFNCQLLSEMVAVPLSQMKEAKPGGVCGRA